MPRPRRIYRGSRCPYCHHRSLKVSADRRRIFCNWRPCHFREYLETDHAEH